MVKGLAKHLQTAVEVRHTIFLTTGGEPVTQSKSEVAFLRSLVVAVDEHHTRILIALEKSFDSIVVELVVALPNLEDLGIAGYVVTGDRERNDELDVARLAEFCKRVDLYGIERTKDDAALSGSRITCQDSGISRSIEVPGVDVDGVACPFQAVASQENATVVFDHTLTVAVDIVKWQCHAHAQHLTLLGRRALSHRRRRVTVRSGSIAGSRDIEVVALMKLIARQLHLGIGIDQLVYGDAVIMGDAIERVTLLHLIYMVGRVLCTSRDSHYKKQTQQKQPPARRSAHKTLNHFYLFFFIIV